MLTDFAAELSAFIFKSKEIIFPWLLALAALWAFNVFNWILGSPFNRLGLYPRRIFGLPGIIFSPFLHGDFSHLFFNSIPLFVLGLALLTEGFNLFLYVTAFIMLLSGILVWLFGRSSYHIGASGVISGYFGYVIVNAYLQPSLTAVFLALLVIYYFGSIFLGIFPQEEQTSWESHLFGFVSGIATALFLPAVIVWLKLPKTA